MLSTTVSGVVKNHYGQPIGLAKVTVGKSNDPHYGAKGLSGITDEDGKFSISGVSLGDQLIMVCATGYLTHDSRIAVSQHMTSLEILLVEDPTHCGEG